MVAHTFKLDYVHVRIYTPDHKSRKKQTNKRISRYFVYVFDSFFSLFQMNVCSAFVFRDHLMHIFIAFFH